MFHQWAEDKTECDKTAFPTCAGNALRKGWARVWARRDAQGPALIPFCDEGEEDLGLLGTLGEVAQVVQEQEVEVVQPPQPPGQLQARATPAPAGRPARRAPTCPTPPTCVPRAQGMDFPVPGRYEAMWRCGDGATTGLPKDRQCPPCGSNSLPKYGRSRGKQTPYRVRGRPYRGGQCLYHFTPGAEHPCQPERIGKLVVDLYTEGSNLEAIGRDAAGRDQSESYPWMRCGPM